MIFVAFFPQKEQRGFSEFVYEVEVLREESFGWGKGEFLEEKTERGGGERVGEGEIAGI